MNKTMNKRALSSVAVAALWACAVPAQADPLALRLSETVSYDSNYARNATDQAEVISSTGVGLTFNKLYGRQNYFASGKFDVNKHKNFKEQDNNSYDVDGRFVSEIASNWALSVNGSSSRRLNSVENNPLNQRLSKNELSQHDAGLNLQYGVAGRWSLLGSLGASRTSYSLDSFDYQNRDQSSGGLRLVYNTSDLLSFGFGVSAANNEYPNQIVAGVPEEVKQRSIDFSTNYQATGSSRLNGILSYAKNKYKSDAAANFKGFTGRLNWDYKPGGATTYNLGLSRSTNNDGSGTGLRNNVYYQDIVETGPGTAELVKRYIDTSYQTVTTSLDGKVRWAPTAKLGFNANVGWDLYKVKKSYSVASTLSGETSSRYRVFGLSADYQYSRAIAMGCSVQQYKQGAESNPGVSNGVPRVAFDGQTVSCNASFTID
ncbi:hypothetical protein [Aquabacterium sp.]|uniref:hypothetical protein n=1 Tax=Aquabacterium sp. TaxID=1872578 RepID=UPI003D6D5DE9